MTPKAVAFLEEFIRQRKLDFLIRMDADYDEVCSSIPSSELCIISGTPKRPDKALKHWTLTVEDKLLEEKWLFKISDLC